MMILNLILN